MNCRLNESAHSEQGLYHTPIFTKKNPISRFPTNRKEEKDNGESRLKQCNNKQSSYCPNAEELEDSQEACSKCEELQTLKTSSGARRTGPVLRLERGPGYIPIVYRICVPMQYPVQSQERTVGYHNSLTSKE